MVQGRLAAHAAIKAHLDVVADTAIESKVGAFHIECTDRWMVADLLAVHGYSAEVSLECLP